MKRRRLPKRLALIVAAVVALSMGVLPAMAQSCALCYTQAASAGSRMIEALKSGIVILILPPTLMSIGMVFIVYRNRNRCRDAAATANFDAIWSEDDPSLAAATQWHRPTR
jgi:cbb3-type cytochrome oxidase subunit 3